MGRYRLWSVYVLLSQKKMDDTIEIDLNLDELDATSAELKATYQEIKDCCGERNWLEGFKFIYFSGKTQMWN